MWVMNTSVGCSSFASSSRPSRPGGTTLGSLRDHDLALTLEAKDVRYGPAGSGNGTIAASIRRSSSLPSPGACCMLRMKCDSASARSSSDWA